MVIYPILASAMRPVPYIDGMAVPKPSNNVTMDKDNSDDDEVRSDKAEERTNSDLTFEQKGPSTKPYFIT